MKNGKTPPPSLAWNEKVILVVDDHKFIRTIVGNLLTSLNVRGVAYAKDGIEAIAMLRAAASETPLEGESALDGRTGGHAPAGAFNCVITDFNMTPLNGLSLLKKIRCGDTSAARDIPVVMLTGHSEAHLIAAAMALDVNAFLLKPVSRDALESKLMRVFGSKFNAKPVEAYQPVEIPEAPGAKLAPLGIDLSKDKHDVGEEKTLDQIKFGAVLARDIRGADGAIIVRRGTIMTTEVLVMLKDLSGMPGMDKAIWVRT